jgi:methyl-accepting chemotaxis protein
MSQRVFAKETQQSTKALLSFEKIPPLIDNLRKTMVNVSAIAEENAAGSEEMSASVQEVAGSMQEVTGSAAQLSEEAKQLEEQIRRFKT